MKLVSSNLSPLPWWHLAIYTLHKIFIVLTYVLFWQRNQLKERRLPPHSFLKTGKVKSGVCYLVLVRLITIVFSWKKNVVGMRSKEGVLYPITCILVFFFFRSMYILFFCLFWKDIHFLSSNNLICLIIFDMASLD